MPSHYLNQCWNIVNWTLTYKLQWNIDQNSCIFIQENAFKNAICKMVAVLSWLKCIKNGPWTMLKQDLTIHRASFRLAPSQWETVLQSNAISHWPGENLESALYILVAVYQARFLTRYLLHCTQRYLNMTLLPQWISRENVAFSGTKTLAKWKISRAPIQYKYVVLSV